MVDRVGQQLGNYRLLSLLGQGGFADVYLGEHQFLKTQTAIKVLQTKMTQLDMQIFLKEAQTIALLKHPHIVRVLDFGVDNATPFLVMDFATQGTLRERHPRGSTISLPTVVSYVKQVASALQYAHDQKMIHRDVKPENMLVESSNTIVLSDFGIAIAAHKTQSLSTQEAIGTVTYMAPEQIKGKARPASDQYSLAVVVYEWLCGVPPFDGSTSIEIAMGHLTDPPPPLRSKVPTILPDMEQVVLKALAKEPEKRYESVQAFVTALEHAAQLTSLPVRDVSIVMTPPILSSVPPGQVQKNNPPADSPVVKPLGTVILIRKEHAGDVKSVAWSPDGTRIASGSVDKTVQVWEAATGRYLLTYQGHKRDVNVVTWSPDGTRIAYDTSSKQIQICNANTGQIVATYSTRPHDPCSIVWSPDSTRIASGLLNGVIQVWEAKRGQLVFPYRGHEPFNPNGSCDARAKETPNENYRERSTDQQK